MVPFFDLILLYSSKLCYDENISSRDGDDGGINIKSKSGGWAREKVHFIRHFLNLKASNSRYTAISYERDILDFFQVETIEQITLEQIIAVNMFDVEHYLLDLRGKGCATATINRKVSSLSSLYKWLLKYQDNKTGTTLLRFNPFGNLKKKSLK